MTRRYVVRSMHKDRQWDCPAQVLDEKTSREATLHQEKPATTSRSTTGLCLMFPYLISLLDISESQLICYYRPTVNIWAMAAFVCWETQICWRPTEKILMCPLFRIYIKYTWVNCPFFFFWGWTFKLSGIRLNILFYLMQRLNISASYSSKNRAKGDKHKSTTNNDSYISGNTEVAADACIHVEEEEEEEEQVTSLSTFHCWHLSVRLSTDQKTKQNASTGSHLIVNIVCIRMFVPATSESKDKRCTYL